MNKLSDIEDSSEFSYSPDEDNDDGKMNKHLDDVKRREKKKKLLKKKKAKLNKIADSDDSEDFS